MSDPISDLITRIKNASALRKERVVVPFSRFKEAVVNVIKDNGFIVDYKITTLSGHKYLEIILDKNPIMHIKRLSKPGQKLYVSKKNIPRPLRGMGLVIISTPMGVISGREAMKNNTGGELICEVW